jgi:collagen type VII alpha
VKRTLRMRGTVCTAVRLLLVMAVCAPGSMWGQQVTLVGDAHVSSAQPAVNSGSLSNLNVGGGYTALVQFDLGMLPAGTTPAQIAKATLRVYCNRADVPGVVQAELVGGAWTESSVTYATLPAMGAPFQTAQVTGAGEFVTFDVTSAVQGWVGTPGTNFGLALVAGSGTVVQFDSKENDETAHAPELEIALVGSGAGTIGPAGPQGTVGTAGVAGPQGVQGATGAIGASGSAGLQGEVGPQGVPGISGTGGGIAYLGTYAAGETYGVGNVVQWGGSSWVSLLAGNVGSAPGTSGLTWGMLATAGSQGPAGALGPQGPMGLSVQGATGSQGQQGVSGPAGATGAVGPQGAMGESVQGPVGSQGPTGVAGPAGSPGLVYQGAYSSEGNYLLGDVVVFQGSSYVSLTGFNVGQTPGVSPAYWGVLTAQGPAGATGVQGVGGPMGPQGLLGPVGPPGSTGAQGAQGIAGEAGGQGIPGTTGAQGLSGPMGSQGPAGPVGMSYQGAYDSTKNYALGDGVLWQGAGWVSLIANNHGNAPSLSTGDWGMFATSGAAGATGAEGPAGVAGLNGLNGLAGAAGPVGLEGPVGEPGTPGLVYRGAYSSVGNYALGDVAVFDGASWVSLVAGNVGETPGVGSAYWGVLTSAGAQGAAGPVGGVGPVGPAGPLGMVGAPGPIGVAGPTGIQGPAGAQGLIGATGAAGSAGPQGLQGVAGQAGAQGLTGTTGGEGLQGPMGPIGAAGPVGMSFVGAYDSTMNYAAGNGVLWQGAGWVSLIADNHGNTPSVSPAAWAMFSATGAMGATGSIGATGAPGPGGPNGFPGATGATGANGTQGLQGEVGPAGARGVAGPMGIQGPAGAQGLTGAIGAVGSAGPQGLQGVAGTAGAQGLTGSTGAMGLQGATGASGAAGSVGPAGTNGTNGLNGTPGLAWLGAWSSVTSYAVNEAVSYGGESYLSVVAGNAGQRPDLYPIAWAVLAQAGTAGAAGATGATGSAGVAGPQGAIGSAGATGATGAAGSVGMNFRGAWSAAAEYAVNDAATFAGSTYLAQVAGSNAEPDLYPSSWVVLAQLGSTGATGAQGVAATVSVGTVTTLAAGSQATAANSGTEQAAVLNFGIPQGAAGSGSGSGTSSGTFTAMYHATSYNTLYYAVNSPNASIAETSGSVLAWVPQGCTVTELDVYSQQPVTITVTLRAGFAGALQDTALSCSPATNGSCKVTGSAVIGAGEFIDLRVNSASGTTAGVWTSLQCQ